MTDTEDKSFLNIQKSVRAGMCKHFCYTTHSGYWGVATEKN